MDGFFSANCKNDISYLLICLSGYSLSRALFLGRDKIPSSNKRRHRAGLKRRGEQSACSLSRRYRCQNYSVTKRVSRRGSLRRNAHRASLTLSRYARTLSRETPPSVTSLRRFRELLHRDIPVSQQCNNTVTLSRFCIFHWWRRVRVGISRARDCKV